MTEPLSEYILRLGDDCLVLGQKLSAWSGHAPSLEVDLGLQNLALDLVGQATFWFDLAAREENKGRDADALAFRRDRSEFRNCRLVAQDNGDFAQTLARQFLFSNYQVLLLEALSGSSHRGIADIAARNARDVAYHVDFCRDWMIRLGDGACLSHRRLIKSLEDMSHYVDELFVMDKVDHVLLDRGISVDKRPLRTEFDARVHTVLQDAGLVMPAPQPAPRAHEMQFSSRSHDVRWGF